jgi:hypothetical protein
MTKVLLAVSENDALLELLDDTDTLKADAQKMVEALIKEEKQNIAKEIFDEIENNWITDIDIELLRENYKGVE